jgi:hypothetical protein
MTGAAIAAMAIVPSGSRSGSLAWISVACGNGDNLAASIDGVA